MTPVIMLLDCSCCCSVTLFVMLFRRQEQETLSMFGSESVDQDLYKQSLKLFYQRRKPKQQLMTSL